jgi:hypothetical protein
MRLREQIRAVPYLGGLVALSMLWSSIRRKGTLSGTVDTAIDMIPWIGGAKIAAETIRGRDFFPDKPVAP